MHFKKLVIALNFSAIFLAYLSFADSPLILPSGGINIIPEVQSWTPLNQDFYFPNAGFVITYFDSNPNPNPNPNLNLNLNLKFSSSFSPDIILQKDAETLSQDLSSLTPSFTSNSPKNTSQNCLGKSPGGICLSINPEFNKAWSGINNSNKNTVTQGYELDLGVKSPAEIDIIAATPEGIFNGTQSLIQLLEQSSKLPMGIIKDWPSVGERSVMLDTGRHYFEVSYLEYLLRLMALYKFNTFHWHLTDWNAFRLDDPENYPGLAPAPLFSENTQSIAAQSYSYEDVQEVLSMADQYHITVIPEIDIPGHSSALTAYYEKTHNGESIAFGPTDQVANCPNMASYTIGGVTQPGWTLDVINPKALTYVEDLVKNFMPWFSNSPHPAGSSTSAQALYQYQGRYFHLGADEYPNNSLLRTCPALIQACANKPAADCSCTKQSSTGPTLIPACQTGAGISLPQPVPGGLFVDFLNQIDQDIFQSAQNNPDGMKMRIWTGWNAASSPGNKYASSAIDPNKDIVIDAWLMTQDLNNLTQAGFEINNTSYGMTYLTPGFAGQNWDYPAPQNYLLNTWTPNTFVIPSAARPNQVTKIQPSENFLGAGFQIWTDGATEKSDRYFDTLLERPLKLIANSTWSGGQSKNSLSQMIQNLNLINQVPGFNLPAAQSWCMNQTKDLESGYAMNTLPGLQDLDSDLAVPWTLQVKVKVNSSVFLQALNQDSNLILTQSDLEEDPGVNLLQLDLAEFNPMQKGVEMGLIGYENGVLNQSSPDSPVGVYVFNTHLPLNQWNILTYIGDRSGVRAYLNGNLIGQNNSVMALPLKLLGNAESPIYIPAPGEDPPAEVSRLLILNRALNSLSSINNALNNFCGAGAI